MQYNPVEYVFTDGTMTFHPLYKLNFALSALAFSALSLAQQALPDGNSTVSGTVASGGWVHYVLDVSDADGFVQATLTHDSLLHASLYNEIEIVVRRGAVPTEDAWDARSVHGGDGETLRIDDGTAPSLGTGKLYLSVHASGPITYGYTLNVTKGRTAAIHAGMGAIPFPGGSTFRVWAPNASAVNVAGSFNAWSTTAAPLTSEGNGNWSIDLRNALPGGQYKFVIMNGSQTIWKNDPRARQLTNSAGNSIIFGDDFAWSSLPYDSPTWDKAIVYEMHIGAFNDSPGGLPGTFDSAAQKLDYLKDLGVNEIELLPVNEFPGDFSWGYNPSYPFSVESAYGGPARLKAFVDAAHQRGIGVLLDVVDNHLGPNDLDLWRFDGWYQNNLGGIYFYNDGRASTPWGDTRPDYGRGEVRQYLHDSALQWLEEFRMDGLRFDSTVNIRRTNLGDSADGWSLMQWLNDEVDAREPWKLMIAEDMQGESYLTRPTASGGAGFDAQWSAQFVHPVRDALTKASDSDRSMAAIRNAVVETANGNGLKRIVYTESHDEDANGGQRLPSAIDASNPGGYYARRRATLGMALALTSPGIPMLAMGQEFLESGYFSDSIPLDFTKATTYAGVRQMVKDLVALRKNAAGNSTGLTGDHTDFYHTDDTNKVVAFHRWKDGGIGDDVVIVQNWANRSWDDYRVGIPNEGRWRVAFSSDWTGYCADFGNVYNPDFDAEATPYDGQGFSRSLKLAPYSTIILVRAPKPNPVPRPIKTPTKGGPASARP